MCTRSKKQKTVGPDEVINAKELRRDLGEVVKAVRSGRRYAVLYRSRPAFRIVPLTASESAPRRDLAHDPVFRAGALGRSEAGDLARRHDEILYGTGE